MRDFLNGSFLSFFDFFSLFNIVEKRIEFFSVLFLSSLFFLLLSFFFFLLGESEGSFFMSRDVVFEVVLQKRHNRLRESVGTVVALVLPEEDHVSEGLHISGVGEFTGSVLLEVLKSVGGHAHRVLKHEVFHSLGAGGCR